MQNNFVVSTLLTKQFALEEKLPAEAFSYVAVVLLDTEVVGPDWVALSLSLVTTSSMALRAVNKRNIL